MTAALALLSAVAYGSGDFLGGVAARRMPATAVVYRTHVIGLVGLLAVAPLVAADTVTGHDVVIGALGGIAGGLGILGLYVGLASGTMAVVAPVTAVLSAIVPVAAGLLSGERPSAVAGVGIAAALVAIVLVARPAEGGVADGVVVALALAAGLGFGLFFVALDATGDAAGLWPLVAGRAASAVMFTAVMALTPTARTGWSTLARGLRGQLVGCGVLDVTANSLFLIATQSGLLTLVSVLAALYPAATIVLARVILGERMSTGQVLGCGLAIVAVALITAG